MSFVADENFDGDDADSDDLQFVDNLDVDNDGNLPESTGSRNEDLPLDYQKTEAGIHGAKEKLDILNNGVHSVQNGDQLKNHIISEKPAATVATTCESKVLQKENHLLCKEDSVNPAMSSVPSNSELLKEPQKIIKHFIEGFTVEESTEPFPVHRSSLLTDMQLHKRKKISRKRTLGASASTTASQAPSRAPSPQLTPDVNCYTLAATNPPPDASLQDHTNTELCSLCGRVCTKKLFYRKLVYCSKGCIVRQRRYIYSQPGAPAPKRGRPFGSMTLNKVTMRNTSKSADVNRLSFYDIKHEPLESSTPLTLTNRYPSENGYESEDSFLNGSENIAGYNRSDVIHWTISDVRDFIQSLGGCEHYAADFEEQEIDGRALLLVNEDHLLNALNVKLGPALKIIEQINAFR